MKKQYPYSNNKDFLSKIDKFRVREQWVKITLLEYNSEIPLKDIEGKIASGTLTKTGDSAVRRTCSLSCVVDTFKYNLDDIQADYSISKKIYLELGITNDTDEYNDEKIIWFPQGVFFITNFAISASAGGAATINLQFKDKMAQLDGTVGGILPATTRFDTVTTIVDGVTVTNKMLVYDIIMEVVNHFGGESLSNIIIDDVPAKAKRIIRWMGNESIWIYPIVDDNNGEISYDVCLTSNLDEKSSAHTPVLHNGEVKGAKEYKTNQDIGYVYEDFVYDEELTFNAGSKITDILDKIKNWLGNYEYFYDEQGQFHFQEVKNYLNNTQSFYIWDKIKNTTETSDVDYLYESTQGRSVYTFDDKINLISITNTPMYENIKNDFIVEGTTTINNVKHTCRYHLVIDDKPTIKLDGYDNVLVYTDPITGNTVLAKPKIISPQNNVWSLPEFAEDGKIYGLLDEPQTHIFKQSLSNMDDFAEYYNNLVNEENSLGINDLVNDSIKQDLFDLLERYMGYNDQTIYKEQYRDTIFTLARHLQRYNISNKITPLSTTQDYYMDLYTQFNKDKSTYGNKIKWCGGLLKLIYNLFNGFDAPDSNYVDNNYWPDVKNQVSTLWSGIESLNNGLLQKAKCLEHIGNIRIKQRELNVLIEQYVQIINNCNVQINLYNKKTNLTNEEQNKKQQLEIKKNFVQNQINNYKNENNCCEERLNILYATLTALGASDLGVDATYYTIDITIPVYTTSFWYYNTNSEENTYGWNELEWYQYYSNSGSMTYIDYSKIKWEKIDYNINTPSMNRNSDWYQISYIPYAEEYNLPYFGDNKSDSYMPINWRTELLLKGLRAEENGTDPGDYYQELKANLPTLYDFKTEQLSASSINYINYFVGSTVVLTGSEYAFVTKNSNETASINTANETQARYRSDHEAEIKNFSKNFEKGNYNYFFDMIDSSSPTWGEYSVKNIGRRTHVNVSNSVNCIFSSDIPDYAFINVSGLTWQERGKALTELKDVAEDIIQVTDTLYNNFATGGFKQSAYEQIKYDLQQYTSYQNTISITAIPCFYLEPNVRVKLNDHSTNTFGDYVVKSISIPFGAGNNMSVSLSKAMERL